MGRGQELLNLVKSIKQEKELQTIQEEIKEVVKPENLKAGVTAFGIEGNKNIVDTTDANLNDYYLHPSYNAYAQGKKINGRANLFNSSSPMNLHGTYTIVNPENPDFILTYMFASGTIKGSVVKIKRSAIPEEYIAGKNICLRANYNTSFSLPWKVEIAVCEWGSKFSFKSDSGYMPIYCRDASNAGTNYTLYHQSVKNLAELNTNNWVRKDVAASNYMNQSLGKTGQVYAYSRDSSNRTSGLTQSSGVPGSNDMLTIRNIVNGNTLAGFVATGAELYTLLDHSTIAKGIGLTAADIIPGKKYLGIEGAATIENFEEYDTCYNLAYEILKGYEYTPYDRLEYIEGTGIQYIDTGVLPIAGNTSAEVEFQITKSASGEQWAFGQWYGWVNSSNPGNGWRCGGSNSTFDTTRGFSYSHNSFLDKVTATSTASTITSPHPMLLFAQQEEGTPAYLKNGYIRIFRCKIWESGQLIRDMIPVQSKETGEIGMYDLVNLVFYKNKGTGTFTKGSIVDWKTGGTQ